MAVVQNLFTTKFYRARIKGAAALNLELAASMRSIARDDAAGRAWSRDKLYRGYTSYASLGDLAWRAPPFAQLQTQIDGHVAAFARTADFDLGARKLALDSLWINILKPGGHHAGHIHPLSVISGAYYVELPEGSGALKLEDPRLGLMMAAPPRRPQSALENRTFHYVRPRAGEVLLWESWLRHEVAPNQAKADRLSVSFNYKWAA